MKIGCDIGGVIKEMTSDDPIKGAIEAINQLLKKGHSVVLISKCNETYRTQINTWLVQNGLDHIEVKYCKEYNEKINIAQKLGIDVMIDDKIQVLQSFMPSHYITKIWFCDDVKKIKGTQKYQPELLKTIRLAKNWEMILEILNELK